MKNALSLKPKAESRAHSDELVGLVAAMQVSNPDYP